MTAVSYTHLLWQRLNREEKPLLARPDIYSHVMQKLMSEQYLTCQILSKRDVYKRQGLPHTSPRQK